MKKIVVKMLIFIIIFNFIFSQIGYLFAVDISEDAGAAADYKHIDSAVQQGINEGTVKNHNGEDVNVDKGATTSTPSAIGAALASAFDTIPMLFSILLNSIASKGGFIYDDVDNSYITVENIVFGKYYMFDVNMFEKKAVSQLYAGKFINAISNSTVDQVNSLKDSVARWYYICRLLAMAIGLITLIYIGIRMAISTVASDRAKYKKMLIGWVQSIVIIAILPYIMAIFYYLVHILMDILNTFRVPLAGQSFEITIMDSTFKNFRETGGWTLVAYSIMFWVMAWMQFKFFMMYLKRFFAVGFLIIISPLITITYSMDKAGDGKAQAFEAWLREFIVNVTIPILQSAIYLVFAFSANEIAKEAPIVGFIFLFSLTRAEKIVKTIFNLKGLVSIRSMRLFKKGE